MVCSSSVWFTKACLNATGRTGGGEHMKRKGFVDKDYEMDDLPDDCIVLLLKYVSFHDISQMRLVSRKMDRLCSEVLNIGFKRFRQMHELCTKQLKDSLPKRESERSKHHLSIRHTMLQSIDTRVSLLAMTYHRYIMEGSVCFIPGKVLDELYRVLRIIQDHDQPILYDTHGSVGFLQELRDLSSMAIEHFDDYVVADLTPNIDTCSSQEGSSRKRSLISTVYEDSSHGCNSDFLELRRKMNVQECSLNCLKQKLRSQKKMTQSLEETVTEQDGRIKEMSRQLAAIQKHLDLPVDNAFASSRKRALFSRDSTAKKAKLVELP